MSVEEATLGLHALARMHVLRACVQRRSIIPISRLNDHLEVPTYNYNPVSSGASRVGIGAVGGGGVAAGNAGTNAIKTAYMPQGFQADFASCGAATRRDGGRETAAPEPMHVSSFNTHQIQTSSSSSGRVWGCACYVQEEEEVPEDWEQHL